MIRVRPLTIITLLLAVSIFTLTGCRGYRSSKPPIHPNPNMDWQAKYKAQDMPLLPPEHTVAWGNERGFNHPEEREKYLGASREVYAGYTANGNLVRRIPVDVTSELVERGREQFNIYCAVCHDETGTGQGTVVKRGFALPPNLSDTRLINSPDGHFFNVMTVGQGNMASYAKQVSVENRWAIVAYIRALQAVNQSASKEMK